MGIRTHRGNPFENRTIEYIIRNPVYIGKLRWNPSGRSRRNYSHPDLLIVDGTHEPIIDTETFEKAQRRVQEIKAAWRPYYKPQYKPSHWLVGLLVCSNCSGSLINNNGSFRCNNQAKGRCNTTSSIGVKTAENAIIDKIKSDISISNINSINIDIINNSKDNQDLNVLKEQLKKAEAKLERCKNAYQAGIDTIEEYKTNKEIISHEIANLNNAIEKLSQKNTTKEVLNAFKITAEKTINILASDAPMEAKNKAAREIISKVVHNKSTSELIINYHIIL